MNVRLAPEFGARVRRRGSLGALVRDGAGDPPTEFGTWLPDVHEGDPLPALRRGIVDGDLEAHASASDSKAGGSGTGGSRTGSGTGSRDLADRGDRASTARRSPDPSPASDWTAGRALATRGATVLLWGALMCGPLGLIASMLAPSPPVTSGAETAHVAVADDRATRAGALAVMLVGAWLSATTDAPEPLVTLLPSAVIEAIRPTAYRDLAVAATEGPDESGVVAVTVAGLVDERSPAADAGNSTGAIEHPAATVAPTLWVPRYFQVTVATEGGLSAVAEPAAVAPPVAAAPLQDATVQLPASGEASTTVALFLSAYLTSSADLDRFVAPGVALLALAGAPYVAVDVRDARAASQPASPPTTGDRLDVRASVAAVTRTEATHTLTYWLTLRARDGRWEVESIAPGPPPAQPSST